MFIGSDCQLSWWTYYQIIHNWNHRNFQWFNASPGSFLLLPIFMKTSRTVFHTFLVTSTAKVLQLLLEPQHPELLDLNRDAWPTALAVDLWRCSPLHRAAERGRSEVPAILRGMLLGEDCLIYKWDVSIVTIVEWCSMGNILIFRDFLGKIGRILIVFLNVNHEVVVYWLGIKCGFFFPKLCGTNWETLEVTSMLEGKLWRIWLSSGRNGNSTGVSSHFISTMWDLNQQKLEFHRLSFGSTNEELVIYNILYIYYKYMICIIYNYIYIAGYSISGRRITWPGRLLFGDQEGRSPEGGPGRQLPVAFRVRLGVCPVGGGAIETEGWGGTFRLVEWDDWLWNTQTLVLLKNLLIDFLEE